MVESQSDSGEAGVQSDDLRIGVRLHKPSDSKNFFDIVQSDNLDIVSVDPVPEEPSTDQDILPDDTAASGVAEQESEEISVEADQVEEAALPMDTAETVDSPKAIVKPEEDKIEVVTPVETKPVAEVEDGNIDAEQTETQPEISNGTVEIVAEGS